MQQNTFLGRIGVVSMLSLGYQVLHIVVVLILVSIIPQWSKPPLYQRTFSLSILNGEPVFAVTEVDDLKFRSIDGKSVNAPENQVFSPGASFSNVAYEDETKFWSAKGIVINQQPSEPWYLVQERVGSRRTGYFVAYSNFTRRPLFYFGAQGQSVSVPSPDQRFQLVGTQWEVLTNDSYSYEWYSQNTMASHGCVALLTTSGLKYVDLQARTITQVVSSDRLLHSPVMVQQEEIKSGRLTPSIAQAPFRVLLYDGAGTLFQLDREKVVKRYVVPEILRDRGFTAFPIGPETIYYTAALDTVHFLPTYPRDLLKSDVNGKISQRWAVYQPPYADEYYRAQDHPFKNLDYLGITALVPMPLDIIGSLEFSFPLRKGGSSELIGILWPSYLVMLLCGVVSVIAGWILAPRFSGAPAQWGWLVYMFVFGVPGLVGYLMHFRHRPRPLLERAPDLGTEVFA